MVMNKFRLALLQLAVTPNISKNLERASEKIRQAASVGAKMICLPECFNFPYEPKYIAKHAEPIPGKTSEMLSRWANENQVYLIGGTLSEREDDQIYTTCLAYGPDGSLLAKHRKVHLYATDVPSRFTFSEAGFLTPGDKVTTFDTPFCKVGVAICYDMGFPSFAELYEQLGCKLLVSPGAFNMYNGPLYWELFARARAADNRVYVASVSPSRDETAYYVLWGHSMLVDPTGKVVKSAGAGEEIVLADVDIDYLDSLRDQQPRAKHRRNDLYKVVVPGDTETNVQASDGLRSAMSTAQ